MMDLNGFIVDQLNTGVVIVDAQRKVCGWNRFMESHTNFTKGTAIGSHLYELFPELPVKWFERKLNGVFMLQSPSFSSWEQRSHLFNLPHNRPFTTESKFMAQNCSMLPMPTKSNEVEHVCILIEDVTDTAFYQKQLTQTMRELEIANRIDGLTNAANRRYWEETLEKEFSRAKRYGHPLSLIMFDLDKFKDVNDTYGHRVGDIVLIELVKFIQPLLRKNDLLGRYGGEEFCILLPETELEQATYVAERIRKEFHQYDIVSDDAKLNVSVSMGVDAIIPDYHHYDSLLTHADNALYESKRTGRNKVTVYQHKSVAC